MVSFHDNKFNFSNGNCDSVECISGQFQKCQKNHTVIYRSLSQSKKDKYEKKQEAESMSSNEKMMTNDCILPQYSQKIPAEKFEETIEIEPIEIVDFEKHVAEFVVSSDEDDEDDSNLVMLKSKFLKKENVEKMVEFMTQCCFSSSWDLDENQHNVLNELNAIDRKTLIGSIGSIDIHKFDLEALDPQLQDDRAYLNDIIIDSMMMIIKEKSVIQIDVVTTHFYSAIDVSYCYSNINFLKPKLRKTIMS